jgi:hypothetical protein
MSHFEVGKKVIALENHGQGKFKKGDVFTLLGIMKASCKCNVIKLNVGIVSLVGVYLCTDCGFSGKAVMGYLWQPDFVFAPYDDSLSELTAEDILEEAPIKI